MILHFDFKLLNDANKHTKKEPIKKWKEIDKKRKISISFQKKKTKKLELKGFKRYKRGKKFFTESSCEGKKKHENEDLFVVNQVSFPSHIQY